MQETKLRLRGFEFMGEEFRVEGLRIGLAQAERGLALEFSKVKSRPSPFQYISPCFLHGKTLHLPFRMHRLLLSAYSTGNMSGLLLTTGRRGSDGDLRDAMA